MECLTMRIALLGFIWLAHGSLALASEGVLEFLPRPTMTIDYDGKLFLCVQTDNLGFAQPTPALRTIAIMTCRCATKSTSYGEVLAPTSAVASLADQCTKINRYASPH